MKKIAIFFYNFIASLSPQFEVALRKFYWKHSKTLKKYRPYSSKKVDKKRERQYVDFDEILGYLRSKGIGNGSLLIVHSAYDPLSCTNLTPDEIVEKLIELIGPDGTLVMPAYRRYKGEPKYDEKLTADVSELVCTYDVKRTVVTTGYLPYTLLHKEGSVVSHHPLNPLVAYGPLAKEMMEHNLEGDAPAPHGPNSAWKFCYDHGAIVIGLGADLNHYSTIEHLNEEGFGNWLWSDEEWYRLRKFIVVDENDNKKEVVVKERKPEWGMLRYSDREALKFVMKNHLRERVIFNDEIIVGYEPAKPLIDALQSLCKKGKSFYY